MFLIKFCFLFSFFFSWSQVTSLEKATLKTHTKGAQIKFLATSKVLGSKNAFIGYLTVPPKGSVPLHRDETEEYLFVQKGRGTLWMNGEKYSLKPQDLIYMPSNAQVRFQNGDKTFEALQIFAGPGPEKKYEASGWQ